MIYLLQVAMIKLPETPFEPTIQQFVWLGISLLITFACLNFFFYTIKRHRLLEFDFDIFQIILVGTAGIIQIFLIVIICGLTVYCLDSKFMYPKNLKSYEIKQEEYQTELSKYSKILIMNKYTDNESYVLVLDDSENTEIEVTKETYNQAALGQPLGRYVKSIKK